VVVNERNFDLKCGHAGQPCSVTDIVQMAQAGVSEDVIVNQIRTTRACFTLDSADIIGWSGRGQRSGDPGDAVHPAEPGAAWHPEESTPLDDAK
jgi:hypothetical protein